MSKKNKNVNEASVEAPKPVAAVVDDSATVAISFSENEERSFGSSIPEENTQELKEITVEEALVILINGQEKIIKYLRELAFPPSLDEKRARKDKGIVDPFE